MVNVRSVKNIRTCGICR